SRPVVQKFANSAETLRQQGRHVLLCPVHACGDGRYAPASQIAVHESLAEVVRQLSQHAAEIAGLVGARRGKVHRRLTSTPPEASRALSGPDPGTPPRLSPLPCAPA